MKRRRLLPANADVGAEVFEFLFADAGDVVEVFDGLEGLLFAVLDDGDGGFGSYAWESFEFLYRCGVEVYWAIGFCGVRRGIRN